ncbi:hypothetical protein QR97_31910 [Streptomyces sp. PBH53]|uniref:hypothetical protein n=1 Tax=Streptomyces sp. PBH53 TaxID=1577075 RepID=UPI000655CFBA|nr:hypothetical protein [Streptomyces sp. PBH53]AKN73728.1 hypothetical protein QR97_31910 [Streptomyces sp. PBH53]
MHDHEASDRLASFADVLAGELPGAWSSTHHRAGHREALAEVDERIWDLDLVTDSLATHPLRQAAVLSRPDGAQLVVIDRYDGRGGFLIAAIAPRDLPDEAYRGVPEPNGIAVTDDPFLAAGQVAGDLLARYEAALAQVRDNALDAIVPSQSDRVVLTWQPDGSLAAAPVGDTAANVLAANGFVKQEQTGVYRLSGDDTTEQARAVRATGQQLRAHGIATALQHPSGRITPTAAAPTAPPAPAAPRASAARSR